MKRLLFSALFFFAAGLSFALENKYEQYIKFKLTPEFEVMNGVIKEFVFDQACKNTDSKESELDWNIKTVSLFSVHTDFDVFKYLALGFDGSFAVPQRTDFMQDYDWLNSVGNTINQPQWMDDDPTELTNFSEHINHLDKFISFKMRLGGNIYLPAEITITPRLTYNYEFIRFTGSGGYSTYKWYDFEIKPFEGKVISYEQELNSILFGLNLNIKTIPRTDISMSFDISPKFTTLTAIDYHFKSQTLGFYGSAFRDQFSKLIMMDSGMKAQYCFSKNHSAGISGRLQYIPVSKGITSGKAINRKGELSTDDWTIFSDTNGGTQRFIWALALNYSFSL